MSHKHRQVIRAASVAAALLSLSAVAVDPIIEIDEPTSGNVLYSDSFPFVQPISFTLHADKRIGKGRVQVSAELKDITVLDVRVDDVTIVNSGRRIRNPFTGVNACSAGLVASASTCVASDARSATVSVPWQVVAPGRYTIVISAKVRSDDGDDVEIRLVKTLNAEYPAPPTVADAYIQADPEVLASTKQHACVLSQIADQQARYETFGTNGGPYDNDLIEADVISLARTCPI
jgi:hypothetical protein